MENPFSSIQLKLNKAAIEWWEQKRPIVYNENMHLLNPRINMITETEHRLAIAVADFIRAAKELGADISTNAKSFL